MDECGHSFHLLVPSTLRITMNKWNLKKIKSLHTEKETIIQDEAYGMEKILNFCVSDRKLVSTINPEIKNEENKAI